jgi:phosphoribosylformylglycinamidine synthase
MLGVIDDACAFRPPAPQDGHALILLGETRAELGGSEALAVRHGRLVGRAPLLDISAEVRLTGLLGDPSFGASAHDLSEGGLAVALAELALAAKAGIRVTLPVDAPPLIALFSESAARAVVSCEPQDIDRTLTTARAAGVPATVLGTVTGDALEVEGVLSLSLDEIHHVYESAIPELMAL